jgi:hypothetical protein
LLRVEHNWIAPDPFLKKTYGLHISKERFWKVDGIFSSGFSASATINYDGTTSPTTGHLDTGLIKNSEDSLVLLYRVSAKNDWSIHNNFTINTQGSSVNKRGEINIQNLQKGEYALGIWDFSEMVSDSQIVQLPCIFLESTEIKRANNLKLNIFPNPANDSFTIQFQEPLKEKLNAEIADLAGRVKKNFIISEGKISFLIYTYGWSKGSYFLKISGRNGTVTRKFFVIKS